MEYRLLGKSDLKISRIGFGTMSLDPGNLVSERLLKQALDRRNQLFRYRGPLSAGCY